MATPPEREELSDAYPNPSNGVMRVGMGKLWDYVTGLLGSTGDAAEARAAFGIADDSDVVHKTGDESIDDVKSFTSSPLIPTPNAGDSSVKGATTEFVSTAGNAAYPPKHIDGLTWVNNVIDANNDIDLQSGHCRDAANAFNMTLASTFIKRLDAVWAAGTNQGGLFAGTKASNTWYHMHLIRKGSDGSIDWGYDTSITAANRPVAYGNYRHIGSVQTDSSGNIIGGFVQEITGGGIDVNYLLAPTDISVTNQGTTPVNYVLSVPIGVSVLASLGYYGVKSGASISIDVYSPLKSDQTTDQQLGRSITQPNASTSSASAGKMIVRTNTSSQIRAVADTASCTIRMATYGYTWGRR